MHVIIFLIYTKKQTNHGEHINDHTGAVHQRMFGVVIVVDAFNRKLDKHILKAFPITERPQDILPIS